MRGLPFFAVLPGAAGLVLGSVVLAHQGVENAAVQARMHNMSAISDNMKIIGQMAKGEVTFDLVRVRNAALAISQHAAETPALFEAEESEPKSEALPAIWDKFDDFTSKARALETNAQELSVSISSETDLPPAMTALGNTCSACHEDFRK